MKWILSILILVVSGCTSNPAATRDAVVGLWSTGAQGNPTRLSLEADKRGHYITTGIKTFGWEFNPTNAQVDSSDWGRTFQYNIKSDTISPLHDEGAVFHRASAADVQWWEQIQEKARELTR
jgi:hypothetical protein